MKSAYFYKHSYRITNAFGETKKEEFWVFMDEQGSYRIKDKEVICVLEELNAQQ